jgi:predicted dehydrogenase
MEILRIVVIGTGGRAGAHLATIPKLKDRYALVGVCDLDEGRAKAASERMGVPYDTHAEALLEATKPHVALIAVPPEGHHTVAAAAAERGVHAITETPMSFSMACSRRMMEDAERNHTLLEVSENVRRWPMERLKRVVVESGVLGEVTQIHCWYASGMYHGISAIRNAAQAPAARVIGHAQNVQMGTSYWFDPFARRAVGEAAHTRTSPPRPPAGARVATWELGVTSFENGVVSVHQYPIGRVRGNHWEIFLTRGEIIAGEFFRYEDGGRRPVAVETAHVEVEGVRTIGEMRLAVEGEAVVWENPLRHYPLADGDDIARADVLVSIHRAATEGAPLDYGGIGGYRDMEMMVGARESALRDSGPLPLPLELPLRYDDAQHAAYQERYGHDPLAPVASAGWKQEAQIAAELTRR